MTPIDFDISIIPLSSWICIKQCPLPMSVQRTMSAEVNPSLVNWLTSMMSMRLHVILEHNPVTEDQIQHYVIYTRQVRQLQQ